MAGATVAAAAAGAVLGRLAARRRGPPASSLIAHKHSGGMQGGLRWVLAGAWRPHHLPTPILPRCSRAGARARGAAPCPPFGPPSPALTCLAMGFPTHSYTACKSLEVCQGLAGWLAPPGGGAARRDGAAARPGAAEHGVGRGLACPLVHHRARPCMPRCQPGSHVAATWATTPHPPERPPRGAPPRLPAWPRQHVRRPRKHG